jgi:hypothetical protein
METGTSVVGARPLITLRMPFSHRRITFEFTAVPARCDREGSREINQDESFACHLRRPCGHPGLQLRNDAVWRLDQVAWLAA